MIIIISKKKLRKKIQDVFESRTYWGKQEGSERFEGRDFLASGLAKHIDWIYRDVLKIFKLPLNSLSCVSNRKRKEDFKDEDTKRN